MSECSLFVGQVTHLVRSWSRYQAAAILVKRWFRKVPTRSLTNFLAAVVVFESLACVFAVARHGDVAETLDVVPVDG